LIFLNDNDNEDAESESELLFGEGESEFMLGDEVLSDSGDVLLDENILDEDLFVLDDSEEFIIDENESSELIDLSENGTHIEKSSEPLVQAENEQGQSGTDSELDILEEPKLSSDVLEHSSESSVSVSESIHAPSLFKTLSTQAYEFHSKHNVQVEQQEYTTEQKEIFSLFEIELQELCDSLDKPLSLEDSVEQLLNHVDQIENLLEAVKIINYDGLTDELLEIYQAIALRTNDPVHEQIEALIIWPFVIKHFVTEGLNSHSMCMIHLFTNSLKDESEQADISELEENIKRFVAPDIAIHNDEREKVAKLEDLALMVSDETHADLLNSFLQELPDQSVEFTRAIEAFIEGKSFDDLDIARRIAHTIKGSGNTVGIKGLANVTHQLEDVLDAIAKQKYIPDGDLAELLLESADCLEVMTEAVLESRPLPSEVLGVYQRILDWANVCDQDGFEFSQLSNQPNPEAASDVASANSNVESSTTEAEAQSDDSSTKNTNLVRVPEPLIDSLVRMAGENMISSGRIHEHTKSTRDSLQNLRKQQAQLNLLMADLEQLVFIRGVSSDRHNVNSEFDPLEIEQYNELHTTTQRLIENVVDCLTMTEASIAEVVQLESVVIDQLQIQKQSQESVMQMRMSPVSQISNRFSRAIRQASRLTGKKVNFELLGENTLVDSNVLQQLADPIMHILRNAIDHGIESREQRLELGKPENGTITLEFDRAGDQITVLCSDDGAGLDHEKILIRAIENNLISEEQSELSPSELSRFILLPGFSTKEEVSQVSGRGIGMDVVNQSIKEIKGSLSIESEQGVGTQISVSLPVSLMSTHALLIDINNKRLAISNHGIDDVVYLNERTIKELRENKVLQWQNEDIPTYTLSSLLQMPSFEENKIAFIVKSSDGSYSAILVPFVIDSRDLVLKPLSQYLPNIDGIVGASVLGDGQVTPVIDLTELNMQEVTDQESINKASGLTVSMMNKAIPCVLVVDDSLSARRSMGQFVSDLGYTVVTAKDGVDAQQLLETNEVLSVITDLEMPRMNGIDLTRHLKARSDYSDIPVFMVTSRSTDKHKDLAKSAGVDHYFTKPFNEDRMAELLNESISVAS